VPVEVLIQLLRIVLTQVGTPLYGTLEFYSNTNRLIETGSVDGSVGRANNLILNGFTSASDSEQPGGSTLDGWTTVLTGPGRMYGNFLRNRHFRNAFGWQDSTEQCEMIEVIRMM